MNTLISIGWIITDQLYSPLWPYKQNGRNHGIVTKTSLSMSISQKQIIQMIGRECCFVLILQLFCMPSCSCCRSTMRGIDHGLRVTAFLAVHGDIVKWAVCHAIAVRVQVPDNYLKLICKQPLTLTPIASCAIDGNFKTKTSCWATYIALETSYWSSSWKWYFCLK